MYNFEAREIVRRDEEAASAREQAAGEQARAAERRYRHGVLLSRAASGEKRARGEVEADAGCVTDEGAAAPPSRSDLAAAEAPRRGGPPAEDERYSLGYNAGGRAGDAQPWYATATCSLAAPRPDNGDSLPARVRREKAELRALAASRSLPVPPAPPPAAPPRPPAAHKSLPELRAERLAREEGERARQAALVAGSLARDGTPVQTQAESKRYHGSFGNAPAHRRHRGQR